MPVATIRPPAIVNAVSAGLLTLLPLVLLMITGFYLFVLPHVDRIDSRPRSDP